ncbi:MAG: hypothetical protein ACJ74F_33185 [Mycobacterium sp.]|uniref:hypothetical protein n=1 Tax=Mycobacterium sp. TaxID=1785 RepID=UPI00389ABC1D
MSVEVRWSETTRAADASQAAYFRGALADEREDTTAGLTIARERLRDLMDGKQMLGLRGMARARFKVRELETKQRELDRLIAALDRRFSAMWSAGR